ncbi:MAG: hypothetical protein QOF48_3773 [Verrucomicrobiota bacterium]
MKNAAARATRPAAGAKKTRERRAGKIHPVVIYPFRQPVDDSDLAPLYELIARLDTEKSQYARPITVMDRKTHYANETQKRFQEFRKGTVARHSDILDAWCVDTCQMWYSGLGMAFDKGSPDDVYWLIPGDFNYGTAVGRDVLGRLHDLPEICMELDQDVCIGEIETDHNNSKQLIDTYGTFALLYNWFPAEARELRQYTERPRSEFFAIRHGFLGEVLRQRWFAYEQTVVMLLQAVSSSRRISRFFVGNVSDLPEGSDSLASAMQQVERTERVLKTIWRERHQPNPGWTEEYRVLEAQSEQVRRTALIVLENLLG